MGVSTLTTSDEHLFMRIPMACQANLVFQMESGPQTQLPSEAKKESPRNEKKQCLRAISKTWAAEVARVYFRNGSERVAELGRMIVRQQHLTWVEGSDLVNIAICGRIWQQRPYGKI